MFDIIKTLFGLVGHFADHPDTFESSGRLRKHSKKNSFFYEYFLNKGGRGSVLLNFCDILVAIVFGHEVHIFNPKFGEKKLQEWYSEATLYKGHSSPLRHTFQFLHSNEAMSSHLFV